ncbi:hypothetical protein [Actinocrispum wychmicini]|uniref:hypothetical protein n=1 Tax=Actinocrispum wychmicini TaxID=1213861 RepID=UPI001043BDBA|nr:hypothetical protein [Actinocrispum wychmicini]
MTTLWALFGTLTCACTVATVLMGRHYAIRTEAGEREARQAERGARDAEHAANQAVDTIRRENAARHTSHPRHRLEDPAPIHTPSQRMRANGKNHQGQQ